LVKLSAAVSVYLSSGITAAAKAPHGFERKT
jgi:hypothetical protein